MTGLRHCQTHNLKALAEWTIIGVAPLGYYPDEAILS